MFLASLRKKSAAEYLCCDKIPHAKKKADLV